MVEAMKNVASLDMELTVEERNLLSVAYKNVIGNVLSYIVIKVWIRNLSGSCPLNTRPVRYQLYILQLSKFQVYIIGMQQDLLSILNKHFLLSIYF